MPLWISAQMLTGLQGRFHDTAETPGAPVFPHVRSRWLYERGTGRMRDISPGGRVPPSRGPSEATDRRRGVDVRVILADHGNHGLLNRSNAVATNIMLRNGIRVYRYPGMSHLQAAVYDGWACVGSANFDKLNLQVNKELKLATSDPETVDELLLRVFAADFERSEELYAPLPVNWINYLAEFASDEMF